MRTLIGTALLSVSLLPFFASAKSTDTTLWVARQTGRAQCLRPAPEGEPLGSAIAQLETRGFIVSQAKVAELQNRAQCFECGCPDGSYNIAEVTQGTGELGDIQQAGWEVVQTEDLPANQ